MEKIVKKTLTTFFVVCFSFVIVEAAEPDQQALFQAHTDLFKSVLRGVRQSLTSPPPVSLFVSYSHDNEVHKRRVEALCEDLTSIGIPFGNIIFDQWSNRPGSHVNIYQNVDKILGAERVILVGSPPLREKYEATEQRGIVSDEISRLRDRIGIKGQEGIIPVWFEESFEVCFPQGIRHIVGRSLSDDCHASFFDFVIDLYQLDANDNPVKFLKQQFIERRNIPESILRDYGDRLRIFQEKRTKGEEDAVREILEAAQREREGREEVSSGLISEIEELRPYVYGQNIEISDNEEILGQIDRIADAHKEEFRIYNQGIFVKNWRDSKESGDLLSVLTKLTG